MSIKQDLIDSERYAAQTRARMGSEAYDEWVKSLQTKYYTLFNSESEVKQCMRKAGYDYKRIETDTAIYIKTHIGSDDYDCVWWLYRGSEIFAVINNSVDESYVFRYLKKVENAFGKQAFFVSAAEREEYLYGSSKRDENKPARKSITTVVKPQPRVKPEPVEEEVIVEVEEVKPEPIPEYTFPTIYTDTSVLKSALKNVGINAKIQGDNFEFILEGCDVSIYKEANSNYDFKVVGKCDLKNIHKYFNKIETEYNKIVQYNILENIKKKVAKSPTMQLEQEEVLEDNSVLLTISV